jgi:hypothetical protein
MTKKWLLKSFIIIVSFTIFSCRGLNGLYPLNTNNTGTEVQLNKKNYKVIKRVSGEANATYILGMGGLSNKHLIEQAKNAMYDNAKLEGGAKAIININAEIHDGVWTLLYVKRSVRVSGYLIEFTE